jgi:hypothetical protein
MAATTDVVKIDKVKAVLQIDGTSEDERLAHLISAVSLELENRLGTIFVQRSFTEKKPGGGKRIYLDRLPIVTVASMQDTATSPNTLTLDTEYTIREDRYLEAIGYFSHAVNPQGQRTDWRIQYTAGWFVSTAVVAADVRAEAIRVIGALREAPAPNAQSVRVGDLAVTYRALSSEKGQTLMDESRNVLADYAGRLY